ncbi:hypothetical protein C8R46DRAFT_33200, partial [Mycena filopes]
MNDLETGKPSVDSQVPYNYSLDELEASCAKIWAVYISEAEKYDKALVESWRGNMDGMLIFAGLFSASLTAFIIESYKTLTPDSGHTTAALLKQISGQLAASASGTTFEVPPETAFVVPMSSVICNVLWFASLGFSLACALVATLVEQWARDFIQRADMRPSPIIRARIFSYLYYGLKRFNMHLVVEVVPLLLHMSLVLFFAGLIAFLLPIHTGVMGVSATLLGIIVVMYCYLTVIPLVSFDSPYRTPLSSVLWRTSQLWQLTTSYLWVWVGRQKQSEERMEGTMVEGVIHHAVQPSPERDNRDLHALIWTIKSLVDNTELEPFIAGIPDILWGPNGRRYKHDHLIRALVDNPEVWLGDRLLGLVEYSESGLLAPPVQSRHEISCLQALWAMGTLSQRGAPLNLPHQLLRRRSWTGLGTGSVSEAVLLHLPAAHAALNWSLLCHFDLLWGALESVIHHTTSTALSASNVLTIHGLVHQMIQDNPNFIVRSTSHREFPLFNSAAVQHIADVILSSPSSDTSSWFTHVQALSDARGTFWDDARHMILINFLMDCLAPADVSPRFEYQSMLDICLSSLPPPSVIAMAGYSALLQSGAVWRGEKGQWGYLEVIAVVLSIIFPLVSISRPVLDLDSTKTLISYLKLIVDSKSFWQNQTFFRLLHKCNLAHLLDATTQYLSSGCSGKNDVETTLEVIFHVIHWSWEWQLTTAFQIPGSDQLANHRHNKLFLLIDSML